MIGHQVGTVVKFNSHNRIPSAEDLGLSKNSKYVVLRLDTSVRGPSASTLEVLENLETGEITGPLCSNYFIQVYTAPGIPKRMSLPDKN